MGAGHKDSTGGDSTGTKKSSIDEKQDGSLDNTEKGCPTHTQEEGQLEGIGLAQGHRGCRKQGVCIASTKGVDSVAPQRPL